MPTSIPEAFRDLLDGSRIAALTAIMPAGGLQTTVVWCNYDGKHVLVNTLRGFQKERNMRRDRAFRRAHAGLNANAIWPARAKKHI